MSNDLYIAVQTPDKQLPPTEDLMAALDDQLPGGITVVVNGTLGSSVTAGQTS